MPFQLPGWALYAAYAALSVLQVVFTPRPTNPIQPATSAEVPDSRRGEPIFVVFGTMDIPDAQIADYFDFSSVAIKSRASKK